MIEFMSCVQLVSPLHPCHGCAHVRPVKAGFSRRLACYLGERSASWSNVRQAADVLPHEICARTFMACEILS